MDIERTIEFILEQQSRFQAHLDAYTQHHKETHDSLESDLKLMAQNQLRQQEMAGGLMSIVTDLGIAQRNTQEKLDALIHVVDGLARRDGQHPS